MNGRALTPARALQQSGIGALLLMALLAWQPANASAAPATLLDPPNKPIGTARGIHPGRVVWVRDPSATRWNGTTGHWWDPQATDQARVDAMLSQSLRRLTGAADDAAAWTALFRFHNQTHDRGAAGYKAGEKIVIKINQNTARFGHAANGNPSNENSINGNPHLILATLRQLVRRAGVAPADITIYDISRYIPDNIFVPCHAEFPAVHFVELEKGGGEGREAAPPERDWKQDVIAYSDPTRGLGRSLPPFITDATYMINLAIMKNHGDVGPTLLAKNHFGTVHGINHGAIAPRRHGESNPLVDLLANQYLGGRTVLYMLDTLYSADGPDAAPRRWKLTPFGTEKAPGWPASLFLSQDAVAIESVGFDFVNAEWGVEPFTDNYLREAALADRPPSGKKYAPTSLGVCEHWNNANAKQYSRNLGTGNGIELVPISYPAAPTAVLVQSTAQSVVLKWAAATDATGYEVKRATRPGGPYTSVGQSRTPQFQDANVTSGQNYFYVVASRNDLGQSADSGEVVAQPGRWVAAVNCGGDAVGSFASDTNFVGGTTSTTMNFIDTTGLVGAAPLSAYQSDRWGNDFSYAFAGLKAEARYLVRLHFAEFFFDQPGKRVFNVAVNSTPVLKDFDILAAAGTKNKAFVKEFTTTATPDGRVAIKFTGVRDNPKCSAIEILQPSSP